MTRAETAAYLAAHDRFAIVSHRRPDGDTLGSSAVLCRGLRKLGKSAWVLENPEITEKYADLHRGLSKAAAEQGDIIVAVDVASANMLPECFRELQYDLRIDHHATANSFSELELVEPGAAACGEIVFDLLTLLGVQLDVPMANALYTAVSTDTGCFRYANTTEHSFRVAAACAGAGAELFSLNQMLFETHSLGRLRLQGWLVEHAIFLQDGQIAICALPRSVEEAFGLTEDDLENISGFPRTIEGVKIAATLRQEREDTVKVSVRAVPGYDAGAICAQFGGGGHKGAAGASMKMTMDEAVNALIGAMPKLS